ncbi:MAG: transcription-repair coupling factor [Ruminococcaceae bacterium]|nr:transcription-repair coupling factor [Oscillospiraceae bacterium]
MNIIILQDIFRRSREYTGLVKMLNEPRRGKQRPYYVSGLSEGAEGIFLGAFCRDFSDTGDPILLVCADEKKAAACRGLLENAGLHTAFYPMRDYNFNNMTASHDFENERLIVLSALYGISTGEYEPAETPDVICTTAEALLQVTIPPALLGEKSIRLPKENAELDITDMTARLVDAGYARVDLVEGAGQFAIRGGIIDVYPPARYPIRIELFGDEVDRIGTFDPITQRFIETIEGDTVIPPAKEILLDREQREEIITLIRRQIQRIGRTDNADEKYSRACTLLAAELAALENELDIPFLDKYLPLVYPDGDCLLDYAEGMMILLDAPTAEERVYAADALLSQSIEDMLENLELPPIKDGCYMREWESVIAKTENYPTVFIDALARSHAGLIPAGNFSFGTRHIPAYAGRMELLLDDLRNYTDAGCTAVVLCATEGEQKSVLEACTDKGYTAASLPDNADNTRWNAHLDELFVRKLPNTVLTMTGEYIGGFELVSPRFVFLDFSSASAKSGIGKILRGKSQKKKSAAEAIMSYADLEVGDFVVHAAYGIGQYMGLENLTIGGSSRDYVHIKYAGTDKLFLPVDQLDLVSKYIGAGSDSGMVKLSKMGGADWTKAKSKAKAATKEMAKELIDLYARRKRTKGIRFDPDDDMCREFAASFEYEETDGQLRAIEDVRRDMEADFPMDRLLCGDVGYGKTEVALRAAFKAVMSGKQVAILVPTTILAYQHYQSFLSRMRAFPVQIDMVSRFRTTAQQQATIRKVRRGETDIIIGTHRLISKDVEFHDLGLIIIDEEQRFGVAQKEKLKQIATNADILTLTATPIPRTLNMAMGGIVDMSILEEAPGQRSPVQTYVLEYDEAILHEAIRRELRRNGQVFYLYNRVDGIFNVAGKLQKAIPDARIAVAHGKMDRDEIEEVWQELMKGNVDILVCTTIIETGVDIPNANTLIIENADHYGLSQLHQIRGRVGRSSRRAFAYFTYKKSKVLSDVAEKRLAAIKEYAEFGAGFKIALRDLEIRGAGNLLGAEQHGHMEAVGYDLYMKLLNEAVIEEKGEVKPPKPECAIDIKCDAFLSKSYIPSAPQRMDMYKKIARIETEEDYNDVLDEMCDRYGEPGSSAVNLCRIGYIKAMARNAGMRKVEENEGVVRMYPYQMDAGAVTKLAETFPKAGTRVSLGQSPCFLMKVPKGERNTEFVLDILKKYTLFIQKT